MSIPTPGVAQVADIESVLAVGRFDILAAIIAQAIQTGIENGITQAVQALEIGTNTANIATKLPSTPMPTGQARTLNTAFQVSQTAPALCFYVVQLAVQAPLLSSQSAAVEVFMDANNPPTTDTGIGSGVTSEQLAGVSLVSIATTMSVTLPVWVPAGDYVELTTSGAGTTTLLSSLELVFSN